MRESSSNPRQRPLTAILALDGSACSDAALALAASLHWPASSRIRAMTVVDAMPRVVTEGLPLTLRDTVDVESADTAQIAEAFAAGQGVPPVVERLLRTGRPATEIVHEADRSEADLVVMGSRGHGAVECAVLGSVSLEVVDHAPCSVLLARGRSARRIVLADDGSDHSRRAVDLVADSGLFTGAELRVVSVVPEPRGVLAAVLPAMHKQVAEQRADAVAAATAEHGEIAERTAARLNEAGLAAEPAVAVGDPAVEIVNQAEGWADLIVVGTHGRSGLERVLLGSVARSVLLHAAASVLVARPPRAR